TFCRFRAERHTAIQPHGDSRRAAGLKITTEGWRNLDGDLEVTAAEPAVKFLAGADRRRDFVEGPWGGREGPDQTSTLRCSILVESAEAQMLDIERNAVTEGDHEYERP